MQQWNLHTTKVNEIRETLKVNRHFQHKQGNSAPDVGEVTKIFT